MPVQNMSNLPETSKNPDQSQPTVYTQSQKSGRFGAKGTLAVFLVVILVAAVGVGVYLVGQQQDLREKAAERISPIPCNLSPQEGRTIMSFKEEVLRSDKTQAEAKTSPISVNLAPGDYIVTLVSYDNHSDKPTQIQSNEEWHAVLSDVNGSVVATTSPIQDLPQTQDFFIQRVNDSLTIASQASSVTALHSAYPDKSSANSIVPICIAFDLLSAPSPTPLPLPSPEPTLTTAPTPTPEPTASSAPTQSPSSPPLGGVTNTPTPTSTTAPTSAITNIPTPTTSIATTGKTLPDAGVGMPALVFAGVGVLALIFAALIFI